MTDHPLKLREAMNVEDFNRREALLGRIWLMKDRIKREIARIAKWNAKHTDQPIDDSFERGVLDYLDGKGPMPTLTPEARDA